MKKNNKLSIEQRNNIVAYDAYDVHKRVSAISKTTQYKATDILEFMTITGYSISDVEKAISMFSDCGISNIADVNTLVKLGLFSWRK